MPRSLSGTYCVRHHTVHAEGVSVEQGCEIPALLEFRLQWRREKWCKEAQFKESEGDVSVGYNRERTEDGRSRGSSLKCCGWAGFCEEGRIKRD